MKKVIVTTTINPVTEAIRRFEAMSDWELVVAGDKKTPANYSLTRGTYLTPDAQEKMSQKLSDAIGWNCIQRRNFGLLWAYQNGADIVAIVDDDNIPYDFWGKNLFVDQPTEVNFYESHLDAFDPIGATNYPHLWHRGFPIQWLAQRKYPTPTKKIVRAGIQADFWNSDPDIDAICRMEHAPNCKFDDSFFPIAGNKMSPFNSQNTFVSRAVLKDYFLFPFVGRMDDIWASFHAQAKGHSVVFGRASVYQERNPHDLTKDMKAEILGYENNYKIMSELAKDSDALLKYLPDNSRRAFDIYRSLVN